MKTPAVVSGLVCLLSLGIVNANASEPRSENGLWPETEPLRSGHLQVSEIHSIYFEVCGNPHGTPLFFLHGGPGDSSSAHMRQMADPERFMIVQHDQRGAGRSLPSGELCENTTQDLVDDIERLREHLGVGKLILVGGSWGTTLALAYAETHPEHVAGMVLRGVFTATDKEIEHIFLGGAAAFFPRAYDRFEAALPDPGRRPRPAYIHQLLRDGDQTTRRDVARAFARYTTRIAMHRSAADEVDRAVDESDPYVMALFETYYMAHRAFLDDDQILRDIDRIAHIPTVIINGRYDLICPPRTAVRLHERMSKSILVVVEAAGHSGGDPGVESAFIDAIATFAGVDSETPARAAGAS